MIKLSQCGQFFNVTCGRYLTLNPAFSSYLTEMKPASINITAGTKKYFLPTPSKIQKGSLILLEYTSLARIGIENEEFNSGNLIYSDYLLTGTGPFTLTRIASNMNSRVLINTLVDTSYYKSIISFMNSYIFFVSYQLTARMSNSSFMLNATINLKNSKSNKKCKVNI